MGQPSLWETIKGYLLEKLNSFIYGYGYRVITKDEWSFVRQSKEDLVVPWDEIYNEDWEPNYAV